MCISCSVVALSITNYTRTSTSTQAESVHHHKVTSSPSCSHSFFHFLLLTKPVPLSRLQINGTTVSSSSQFYRRSIEIARLYLAPQWMFMHIMCEWTFHVGQLPRRPSTAHHSFVWTKRTRHFEAVVVSWPEEVSSALNLKWALINHNTRRMSFVCQQRNTDNQYIELHPYQHTQALESTINYEIWAQSSYYSKIFKRVGWFVMSLIKRSDPRTPWML